MRWTGIALIFALSFGCGVAHRGPGSGAQPCEDRLECDAGWLRMDAQTGAALAGDLYVVEQYNVGGAHTFFSKVTRGDELEVTQLREISLNGATLSHLYAVDDELYAPCITPIGAMRSA
jgi:hypothetical protein